MEDVNLLRNGTGGLGTHDMENVEVLNDFFAGKTCIQES